jgi:hypothetical protein
MNKWLVLILSVIISLKSFSQSDTTQISLNNQTVKLVIKDLIKGDGCKEELNMAYTKIAKLEEKDVQKNEKIVSLEEKDSTNQFIIGQQTQQIGEFKIITEELQTDLDTANNQIKWWKRGAFGGGGAAIILLIILL